jgi:cysteine dioxygenase
MEKPISPPISSLEQLIEELYKAFGEETVDPDRIKDLLEAYKSNPRDWKKYVFFDPHRYTRNLIDNGNGKFNLFALCWSEGQGSSIHSHSDAHCFVKILHGSLKETLFEWPNSDSADEQPMQQMAVHTYGQNGVTYINDTIGLHRMENPSNSEGTVSLHLYTPPFVLCNKFDELTGQTSSVKMSFWSCYGSRTAGESVECSQRLCHRWRPLYDYSDPNQELRCM